ncbi:hypothetical protein CIB48_g5724 [Xylaria polymorpha]|nr:hypothetical protein CIB48_g5724 [Xylaria polymorpha]
MSNGPQEKSRKRRRADDVGDKGEEDVVMRPLKVLKTAAPASRQRQRQHQTATRAMQLRLSDGGVIARAPDTETYSTISSGPSLRQPQRDVDRGNWNTGQASEL